MRFLDVFFVVFHGALVLFNLTGWIWRRTRRAHLYTITATLLSWTALGLFFGFGYCPCTDWHWDVKRALGETNLPNSYIKYYVDRITGVDWDPHTIDVVVLASTLAALAASIIVNVRDRCRGQVADQFRIIAIALVAIAFTTDCAPKPLLRIQSDTMGFASRAPVEMSFRELRAGTPPLVTLYFDITLRNQREEPRWFLLPKSLAPKSPAIGSTGGVDGLEVISPTGTGRVIIGRFLGTGGFQAMLLPPQSTVKLVALPIEYWGDLPERAEVEIAIARHVYIDGHDIRDWFAVDPTCSNGAEVAETPGAPMSIVEARRVPEMKELPIVIDDDVRIALRVWLER